MVTAAVAGPLGGAGGSDVLRALGHGRPPALLGPVARPVAEDGANAVVRRALAVDLDNAVAIGRPFADGEAVAVPSGSVDVDGHRALTAFAVM
jgi:hypothetical protein